MPHPTPEQIERVARAMCVAQGADPDKRLRITLQRRTIAGWEQFSHLAEFALSEALLAIAPSIRNEALREAAKLTKSQAQAFRDDAHNRKQFGDSMMHKRGLAVAAYFDQHAAAILALVREGEG